MGCAQLVAEDAAEHDEAVLDQPVHEGRVLSQPDCSSSGFEWS